MSFCLLSTCEAQHSYKRSGILESRLPKLESAWTAVIDEDQKHMDDDASLPVHFIRSSANTARQPLKRANACRPVHPTSPLRPATEIPQAKPGQEMSIRPTPTGRKPEEKLKPGELPPTIAAPSSTKRGTFPQPFVALDKGKTQHGKPKNTT